jgi:Protein of unknown function (DUF1631)
MDVKARVDAQLRTGRDETAAFQNPHAQTRVQTCAGMPEGAGHTCRPECAQSCRTRMIDRVNTLLGQTLGAIADELRVSALACADDQRKHLLNDVVSALRKNRPQLQQALGEALTQPLQAVQPQAVAGARASDPNAWAGWPLHGEASRAALTDALQSRDPQGRARHDESFEHRALMGPRAEAWAARMGAELLAALGDLRNPGDRSDFIDRGDLTHLTHLTHQGVGGGHDVAWLEILQSRVLAGVSAEAATAGRVHLQARGLDHPVAANSPDCTALDLVTVVFDSIEADPRIADPIKQQVQRLQLVAVRQALAHPGSFARRTHPFRRFLAHVLELASVCGADFSEKSALVHELRAVIDAVLNDQGGDAYAMGLAVGRVQALIGSARTQSQALEQPARPLTERTQPIKAEQARLEALLAHRIGRDTPLFVRSFLLQVWSEVMAVCSVDADRAALTQSQALELAQRLLWSVEPKRAEEVMQLAGLLPGLLRGLSVGLHAAGISESRCQTFFDQLIQTHARAMDQAKAAVPTSSFAAAQWSADDRAGRPSLRKPGFEAPALQPQRMQKDADARTDAQGEKSAFPAPIAPAAIREGCATQLQRGDHIEVDEDGACLRYKLAWISPSRTLYVLSRYPDKGRSIGAAELSEMLAQGKVRVVAYGASHRQPVDLAMADRAGRVG